jgi:hypothetical protein
MNINMHHSIRLDFRSGRRQTGIGSRAIRRDAPSPAGLAARPNTRKATPRPAPRPVPDGDDYGRDKLPVQRL